MPQYSYTVINKDSQQLNGTINAPDEQTARKELNTIGFSILSLNPIGEGTAPGAETTAIPENIIKFAFEAIDKNGKKIVGTIQGEEIFEVYKRLLGEYQFSVEQLYPDNLSEEEVKKARMRGIDDLKDRLTEEHMASDMAHKRQEMDEVTFQQKQAQMKEQVDFVLKKVSDMLSLYQEELDPTRKAKIKYFVEKILRIKNSTNLEYIRQSCEELLTYLQKEEIFLNQEQRRKEKTQLSIEAKSMMMELNKINNPAGKDIFDSMREWRKEHITNNPEPTFTDRLLDIIFTPLIGVLPEDEEIIKLRNKIKNTNSQLKEFLIIYFQAPDSNFKAETKTTLLRLWTIRKQQKRDLKTLIHQKIEEKLANIENTSWEILEKEIFSVAGWVLAFYISYYFVTIYLNSKQISFIPETRLNLLFQTSIVKYFFTTIFFFVCFLGIKIEFFKRKPLINPVLLVAFLLSSSLIILNF